MAIMQRLYYLPVWLLIPLVLCSKLLMRNEYAMDKSSTFASFGRLTRRSERKLFYIMNQQLHDT
jgi:hypothetical protein